MAEAVNDVAVQIAEKHNLPKLIPIKQAVGKTVTHLKLYGINTLIIFTDNTAVFVENKVDDYDDTINTKQATSPSWPYILALGDFVPDRHALEMNYLTESRKREAVENRARERTEYERLKAKFEAST